MKKYSYSISVMGLLVLACTHVKASDVMGVCTIKDQPYKMKNTAIFGEKNGQVYNVDPTTHKELKSKCTKGSGKLSITSFEKADHFPLMKPQGLVVEKPAAPKSPVGLAPSQMSEQARLAEMRMKEQTEKAIAEAKRQAEAATRQQQQTQQQQQHKNAAPKPEENKIEHNKIIPDPNPEDPEKIILPDPVFPDDPTKILPQPDFPEDPTRILPHPVDPDFVEKEEEQEPAIENPPSNGLGNIVENSQEDAIENEGESEAVEESQDQIPDSQGLELNGFAPEISEVPQDNSLFLDDNGISQEPLPLMGFTDESMTPEQGEVGLDFQQPVEESTDSLPEPLMDPAQEQMPSESGI